MEPSVALKFQNERLFYRFNNVDLLQEAVTHSLDPLQKNRDFSDQNRTFGRLQIIGNAVVKFCASYYVTETSPNDADEGRLTKTKEAFVIGITQDAVASKLFEVEDWKEWKQSSAKVILRVQGGTQITNQPKKFLRALLGAVYIDAGGASGNGVVAVLHVFYHLWRRVISNMRSVGKDILSCFDVPKIVLEKWKQMGINDSFYDQIESCLGMKFKNHHLLGQAFVHKSFYENSQWGPDYQRMEFLGDSVIDLVVTELLWNAQPPDEASHKFNQRKESLINGGYQQNLFKKLHLQRFVKKSERNKEGLFHWNGYDDVVESLVAAIYIDKGIKAVKNFVEHSWGLPGNVPALPDVQTKLGYKFRNADYLAAALVPSSVDDFGVFYKLHPVLKYFGKHWISFHVTDYCLRTATHFDDVDILRGVISSMCDQDVKEEVEKLIKMSATQHLQSLETLVGAVFKDMQDYNVKISLGKIFYRLWNPFLDASPRKKLTQCEYFQRVQSKLEYHEILQLQESIRYTFKESKFLQQALDDDNSSFYSWFGDTLVDLVVAVYLTILLFMEASNYSNGETILEDEVNQLHRQLKGECLKKINALYCPALRLVGIDTPAYATSSSKSILAAVYFDMEEETCDKTFAKWKDYFILKSKFIGTESED